MFYDTQAWQDQDIDIVMQYLFEYASVQIKQQQYSDALANFKKLDMPALYLLFSLVQENLPKRAKMLFVAEDYKGKQEMLLEVMAHLATAKQYCS